MVSAEELILGTFFLGNRYVGEIEAMADGDNLTQINLTDLKSNPYVLSKFKKEKLDEVFTNLDSHKIKELGLKYIPSTMTVVMELDSSFYQSTSLDIGSQEYRPWEYEALRPSWFSGQFRLSYIQNFKTKSNQEDNRTYSLYGGISLWRFWFETDIDYEDSEGPEIEMREPRGFLDFPEKNIYFNLLNTRTFNYAGSSKQGSGIRVGNRGEGLTEKDIRNEYSREIELQRRSLVSVFVNDKKVSSVWLDKGKHTLNGMPFYNEFNDVRIEMLDDLGKKSVIEYDVLGSSSLVAPGKFYWDLSATGKRDPLKQWYESKLKFEDYFVGLKYGLTKTLTLENAFLYSGDNLNFSNRVIWASKLGTIKFDSKFKEKDGENLGQHHGLSIPFSVFNRRINFDIDYENKEYQNQDYDTLNWDFGLNYTFGPLHWSYQYYATKEIGGWFNDGISTDLSLRWNKLSASAEYDISFNQDQRENRYRVSLGSNHYDIPIELSYNSDKEFTFSIDISETFKNKRNSLTLNSKNDERGSRVNANLSHQNDYFDLRYQYATQVPRSQEDYDLGLSQNMSLGLQTSLFFTPQRIALVNAPVGRPFALTNMSNIVSNRKSINSLATTHLGNMTSYDLNRINVENYNKKLKKNDYSIYQYRNSGAYLELETYDSAKVLFKIVNQGLTKEYYELYLYSSETGEYHYRKTDANGEFSINLIKGRWKLEDAKGKLIKEISVENDQNLVIDLKDLK